LYLNTLRVFEPNAAWYSMSRELALFLGSPRSAILSSVLSDVLVCHHNAMRESNMWNSSTGSY